MHICNSTTKLVFVVLFLQFSSFLFRREKGERPPPSHAMGKRNYLKTDRSTRNSLNRKALIAAAVLVVLYLLASFIFGEMGLIKYYRMQAQYNSLTQEIATLKQDNARLLRDVHALKTDPDYLEILARDKLGLARQGEIVYYYGEP
jgi:cell division protein FtsB